MVNARFLVNQVESEINRLFADVIDMVEYDGKKNNQRKDALNSRSIAAYALHILAEVGVNAAADAIVDGYDDNGIDALLFHKEQNILWLVQAKWVNDGQSPPAAKDLRSFKDGIFDLLSFDVKSNRFNPKFSLKQEDIMAALRSPGLKIKIVVAYTGPELSKNARRVLDDCLEELNDGNGDLASLEIFDLAKAYKALTDSHEDQSIDVNVTLMDWGRLDEPYKAFYGRVRAIDAAQWWTQYRGKLFAKNIREFIGQSDVNDDIKNTLENEPALFWYLNNGVTILCENITRLDVSKGSQRKEGLFQIKGISIVNGAQTIGSIGQIYQKSSPEQREQLEQVEFFVKFVSLDGCSGEFELSSSEFGLKVTRATNTQNKVEVRDFVALDPQQERLSKEFRSNGRVYHYKRKAELFSKDEKNYELEEATIALACSSEDVNLVMLVKQDLTKVWINTSKYPYVAVFKPSVDAIRLWRQIDVKRLAESVIADADSKSQDQLRSALFRYGDLFLLTLVFKQMDKKLFSIETSEESFLNYVEQDLNKLVDNTIELASDFLDKHSKPNTRWRVFNNTSKLRELQEFVLRHK
jgi:AIPR protein